MRCAKRIDFNKDYVNYANTIDTKFNPFFLYDVYNGCNLLIVLIPISIKKTLRCKFQFFWLNFQQLLAYCIRVFRRCYVGSKIFSKKHMTVRRLNLEYL